MYIYVCIYILIFPSYLSVAILFKFKYFNSMFLVEKVIYCLLANLLIVL